MESLKPKFILKENHYEFGITYVYQGAENYMIYILDRETRGFVEVRASDLKRWLEKMDKKVKLL